MKLPRFIYETLPLIYFALGALSTKIEYGTFSATMFFTACAIVHTARYTARFK